MNSSENRKKRYKPAHRVSLTPTSVDLLGKLLGQVQKALPELKLSKTDLVNWLLKSHAESLTEKELAAIERDHFDPVKALESAVAEAKKQQVRGSEVDLHALLDQKWLPIRRKASRTKPRKSKDSDAIKGSF